ncbi:PQQ-binding-like beta-propeller repeat protein [Streptomyces sp. NBC_00122]|uniref:outer membrane protein assembly factor BamB family protein n=1 Tax=Streptomyces sp. NBC_00122 TaxID=2903623 RepID=UPI0032520919
MTPRVAHDPPAKFSPSGVLMPWEASSGLLSVGGTWLSNTRSPVVLHHEMAYVATPDRLLAFDTTNAETKDSITPEGEPLAKLTRNSPNGAAPPVVTGGSTSPLVLAPFLVRQAAVGTQSARTSAEIVAADAATGKFAWRLPFEVPEWTKEVLSPLTVSVVGSSGNVAVVTLAHKDSVVYSASTTYAIDLTAHRVLWTQDMFKASAVTEGMVTGEKRNKPIDDYSTAVGYDLTTGAERWHGEELYRLDMQSAGPHLVFLTASDKSDYRTTYQQFLDPMTGAVKQNLSKAVQGSRCDHDGADTVVCFGRDHAVGFEGTSGATLWELPDKKADRIAPRVTSVWHGRVYGRTGSGTVALDARTGADVPAQPGIAPDLVNGYIAIAIAASSNELMAYQTAG